MSLVELVGYATSLDAASPDPEWLRARYRGTLLGLAAGNALGVAIEGQSAEEIQERYPDGVRDVPVREIEAPWDDDLAQAMLLGEAVLDAEQLDPGDLALRLVDWRRENGRGIGILTTSVIDRLAAGVPVEVAARQVWEESGRRSAGNGAVMRCAPVALRWRGHAAQMIHATAVSAQVTHADPRCIWSAVALNVALTGALAGRTFDAAALADALARAGAVKSVVETVARSGHGFVESLELGGRFAGYTLKALGVGLWCLARGHDLEETLVAVVSAGGDTDTNGAVAGAVLGAMHGEQAIPTRWLDHINDIDDVGDLADALFERSLS